MNNQILCCSNVGNISTSFNSTQGCPEVEVTLNKESCSDYNKERIISSSEKSQFGKISQQSSVKNKVDIDEVTKKKVAGFPIKLSDLLIDDEEQ